MFQKNTLLFNFKLVYFKIGVTLTEYIAYI